VGRVFTHLLQLRGVCLDVLHSRFLRWTKPLTPSLLLETLADLGRSKAELMAENALLRHQLIILSRQVKRPACTRTDRMLLVFLARLVRTWQQALFIVQPETLLTLASGALSPGLETQVSALFSDAEARCRNYHLDQGDGDKESPSSVPNVSEGNS
jgi:hypothetical protein